MDKMFANTDKIFETILENFQKTSVQVEKSIQENLKPKIVAELTLWNNTKEKQIIQKDWIDDMVFAVEAQMFVENKTTGLTIQGSNYKHIDIYEIV